MRGLYFGVLGEAEILIEGKSATPQRGTALFVPVSRLIALTINPLRILGIENVEAFLNAECLSLDLPSRAITVLRWNWGQEWRSWLEEHDPELFYAGDYDWAGVSIFEHEVLPFSPEAQLLVPDDLQQRLEKADSALFHRQEDKFRAYQPVSAQGSGVYQAVQRARRALEQEALIARFCGERIRTGDSTS